MLVGHNPGLAEFVGLLTGGWHELKTCTVAVLELDGNWSDLAEVGARLASLDTVRAG